MTQHVKIVLDDILFILSIFSFIIILFWMAHQIIKVEPALSFTHYGLITIPSEPHGASYPFNSKIRESADQQAVKFYKITVKHAEPLSLITLQRQMNIDTLISVNKFKQVEPLRAGQSIIIPDRDGLIHHVRRRDSLESLALYYGQPKEKIMLTNDLSNSKLFVGQELFIDGATLKAQQREKLLKNVLLFPVAGVVRNFYGASSNRLTALTHHNDGIDISTIDGQDVISAASGYISDSGFHPTYGYYNIVTHPNGLQTFYGYLSSLLYKKGTALNHGDKLGEVGKSGISNGGLLHFSVFKDGSDVDPLLYLR